MKKISRAVLCSVITMAVFAPIKSFATNGYFSHGYGTKNKGLAGGGVALPQDAMIAATNPAGMVMVGSRLDAGAAIFSPSPRSYSATAGTAAGKVFEFDGVMHDYRDFAFGTWPQPPRAPAPAHPAQAFSRRARW